MAVPLQSPDYSCISKRAKTVDIKYRLPAKARWLTSVIDATGLQGLMAKANGKFLQNTARRSDEWAQAPLWRWMPQPMRSPLPKSAWRRWRITRCYRRCSTPLRRKIKQVSADGAYDTKACHALLKKKGRKPPYRREKCGTVEEGHPRNEAVTALKAGELKQWKKRLRLSPALDSRDRHVPVQATHRANAEPGGTTTPRAKSWLA